MASNPKRKAKLAAAGLRRAPKPSSHFMPFYLYSEYDMEQKVEQARIRNHELRINLDLMVQRKQITVAEADERYEKYRKKSVKFRHLKDGTLNGNLRIPV